MPEYPDFRFAPLTVRDVTESQLKNPTIVPASEKKEGQTILTMLQYLRSVVPPTVAHSRIAPDRIAAHLINGWENMIGVEMSSKFSALAAINFLENPNTPIATDTMLHRFLDAQETLMSNETKEYRARLQTGLLEMALIIRQTGLLRRQIAESAFVLVSTGSEVIGGRKQALKQIHGILSATEANQKLTAVYPQVNEREQKKLELGNAVARVLDTLATDIDRSQLLTLVSKILRDPDIAIAQVEDIFQSSIPAERYTKIRQGMNAEILKSTYVGQNETEDLNPVEERLIDNFDRVTHLQVDEIRKIIPVIRSINESLASVDAFQNNLRDSRENLLNKGVSISLILDTMVALDMARDNILNASTTISARRRLQEIRDLLAERQRKITFQLDINKIGQITEEVYGPDSKAGQGAVIKTNIAACILREVGTSDEGRVRIALNSLRSLSPDLQALVIKGEMRLQVAIQKQIARGVAVDTGIAIPSILPEDTTTKPSLFIDEAAVDRESADKDRVEINNKRLTTSIRDFLASLEILDLEGEEISAENVTSIHDLLRKIGQSFFNHPDVVRIIEEGYPQLLQEVARLRSLQVQKEQADITAESKTQI